ncbi:helix-turn-helix transcriptional regulator [Streptomyces sp. NPDC048629]|uniref:Helix-turn-helix transcriptional regulator n=1 Tax=Streptomyces solicathayae TaxID=3081768 RepID=A0ABZ0M409_9ACTN|nr:helix-turn-helix transcriptional regulator [Streptomyces sp. HUAS YS2]WOX26516.1 helix-turn-helix transcriptional regulator [Streptomyces sp. HUAS YS2]
MLPLRPAGRKQRAEEPLWRDVVGNVLRRERRAQGRTLQDVADAARISMPYLSEIERGRKEASSELLAAAARGLGLGLADVLTLAQEEIVRLTGVATLPTRRSVSAPRQGEVRLAA